MPKSYEYAAQSESCLSWQSEIACRKCILFQHGLVKSCEFHVSTSFLLCRHLLEIGELFEIRLIVVCLAAVTVISSASTCAICQHRRRYVQQDEQGWQKLGQQWRLQRARIHDYQQRKLGGVQGQRVEAVGMLTGRRWMGCKHEPRACVGGPCLAGEKAKYVGAVFVGDKPLWHGRPCPNTGICSSSSRAVRLFKGIVASLCRRQWFLCLRSYDWPGERLWQKPSATSFGLQEFRAGQTACPGHLYDCSFGSCLCGSGQTRRKDQEKPSGTGQDCKAVGWDRRQKDFGCVQDAFAGVGCQVGSEELQGAGLVCGWISFVRRRMFSQRRCQF